MGGIGLNCRLVLSSLPFAIPSLHLPSLPPLPLFLFPSSLPPPLWGPLYQSSYGVWKSIMNSPMGPAGWLWVKNCCPLIALMQTFSGSQSTKSVKWHSASLQDTDKRSNWLSIISYYATRKSINNIQMSRTVCTWAWVHFHYSQDDSRNHRSCLILPTSTVRQTCICRPPANIVKPTGLWTSQTYQGWKILPENKSRFILTIGW